MPRFFVAQSLTVGDTITLPDNVYRHWCVVLRAVVGDTAVLFNGQGGEYHATITRITKKQAQVYLSHHNPINRTPPYQVTLIQALSKGDRMDYSIQKACEMGVHTIQLITTEYSDRLRYERDQKKLTHWQAVAVAACEQCGLNIPPTISPPLALADYLPKCDNALKLMLAPSSAISPSFMQAALPSTIGLLVGAEGGLSDTEQNAAIAQGFIPWQIGNRILRTETAGVVAMAALHALHALRTPAP